MNREDAKNFHGDGFPYTDYLFAESTRFEIKKGNNNK